MINQQNNQQINQMKVIEIATLDIWDIRDTRY